ncbi:ATP-binding protein [Streptomyces sp. TR06-5]|uniref:ATP-binding protein n=1 Tax=unclassified Streptomyces TaxID=2593676 RepID=UPI0039A056E4
MVQHDNDHSGEENAEGRGSGSPTRTVRLISGDYLLTVNPVDGSEIEPCPPVLRRSGPLVRRSGGERAGRADAGPSGPPPLCERDEERERLTRLLGQGRSVRLTGPRGSGRTALLDALAAEVSDLAPDGVVRLSGLRRSISDLLQDLFAAVYDAADQRPDRRRLVEALSTVGAVVVVDDLEVGGELLDELLAATPECAYVFAATPDVPSPSETAALEEVFLSGLSRTGALEMLERCLERPLTDHEADWAGDLWFLGEGKPLLFRQAAALLRQRDRGTGALHTDAADDDGLPSGIELAAPLARGLSPIAREALGVAIALGGELPSATQLPAILREDHADRTADELFEAGLLTEADGRLRLAHGVVEQLGEAHEDTDGTRCRNVARHYAWWVAHPSVPSARVAAEADAVVAAVQSAQRAGAAEDAVRLARAAAPVLAAASRRGAWERLLRTGQEAARSTGEITEQAYFHHELGVLALCEGHPERARAELDASIALRAALADKHGTVAGRRTLALVMDRLRAAGGGAAGITPGTTNGPTIAGAAGATGGPDFPSQAAPAPGAAAEAGTPDAGVPAAVGEPGTSAGAPTAPTRRVDDAAPLRARDTGGMPPAAFGDVSTVDHDGFAALDAATDADHGRHTVGGRRGLAVHGTRKNVLAAGAGALLAAVLGTVMTLGAASDSSEDPSGGPGRPGNSDSLPDTPTDGTTTSPAAGGDGASHSSGGAPAPGHSDATTGPTGADESASPSGGPTSTRDPRPTPGGDGEPGETSSSPAPTHSSSSPSPSESSEPSSSPSSSPSPTGSPSGSGSTGDGDSASPDSGDPVGDVLGAPSPSGGPDDGTGGAVA